MARKEVIILKNINIRTLCRVSVLIALEIVLSRFCSFNTPTLRIGIGFVPIALCGIMYGPLWAGAAWGISDLLGTVISGNGIYPPITLTYILMGVAFGLLLHRKNAKFFPDIILCSFVINAGLSLCLNTYWLSILSKTPYLALLVTRIPQCVLLFVLYLILIPLLQKLAVRLENLK